ncbi:MAG TPA: histidinol-phosphate transaminase [Methanocorpusculum sp.]|nr:histidinol-phosphate transaminase [Methanocorpusculum sp.]
MPTDFPKKVFHGGHKASDEGKNPVLDVSASLNPFAPDIPCTFSIDDVRRYPDDSYAELKEAISKVFKRPAEEICVGNGSAELIRVYCQVIFGKSCRINMPTFEEYALSAELAGKNVTSDPEDWDVRFICNPDNPTGVMLERGELCSIVSEAEDAGQQIFVDEAFMDLAETNESVSDVSADNLFVLRSLTKSFAVPGLRFGFGFGCPKLIEKIETARTPWSVNSFAELFAKEAFERYGELRLSAKKISREREWFFEELERRGIPYFASKTNYICLSVGKSAADVTRDMLREGVCVRDCTSFGLPENIRISVETREKNKIVLEALDKCLR